MRKIPRVLSYYVQVPAATPGPGDEQLKQDSLANEAATRVQSRDGLLRPCPSSPPLFCARSGVRTRGPANYADAVNELSPPRGRGVSVCVWTERPEINSAVFITKESITCCGRFNGACRRGGTFIALGKVRWQCSQ